MSSTRIYRARRVITMDRDRPSATHVAVREGRVLAVGGADCAVPWGGGEADDRFAEAVLMPGFVEGHAHLMAGLIWRYAYVGYHDRFDPDGRLWRGQRDLDAVVAGMRRLAAETPPGQPLVAWGFDPIFLPGERLHRRHLDAVAGDRPVAVLFSNFHLMCVNSAALALVGYGCDTAVEGVIKGGDGEPTGELQEIAAMFPIMRRLGIDFRALAAQPSALGRYGAVAVRAGVTTATDLYASLSAADAAQMAAAVAGDDCPVRLVPALAAAGDEPAALAERALALRALSTDKLRLGAVKIMTDGSIQGWTARVAWPGYIGGQPNGLWNTPPALIAALCLAFQRAGVQMHIHVNGDEAAEVAIEAIAAAARQHPWADARHVLQHGQMMGAAQFRRCAELGICVNLFANHLWYFGDQHAALTIGEERAERMDACRAALDAGVALAIHSDAPVTPMGPLFTAWCAVQRQTASGRTLGAAQRITVGEALHAITLGAAHTLKLDAEIGSISVGKRADFAVLGEDPSAVEQAALKDVPVLGTVLGGVPQLP